jgi:hypothetical protein
MQGVIHINQILKKYEEDITYHYLESIYLSCYYKTKGLIKQDRLDESYHMELLEKYFYDRLEVENIDYKDVEKIVEYFLWEMPRKLKSVEQKRLIKKVMASDAEPMDIVEDALSEEDNGGSIQTSGDLSADIGMNRKKNPIYHVQNLYSDK